MEKLGTDHLLPLIMLGLEVGNVADKMGRSKGMERYFHLTALFDEVQAMQNVNLEKAKEQFNDLDNVEKAEIMEAIKEKFDIVDDKLEQAIEESLEVLSDVQSLISKSIRIYKRLKA